MKEREVNTMKTKFIKAIQECGIDITKLKFRYIAKGKYNEPEIWVYPKNNPKQQRMNRRGAYLIYQDGSPAMENTSGMLITKETLENKEFLKEYLENCLTKV